MKEVYCDECNREFVIEIQTEKLKGNIEKVYFSCPHCKTKYTSYYTNVLVQIKQRKVRVLADKYNKDRKENPKQAAKTYKQYLKAKKAVAAEMEKLKKRVEN